MNASRPSCLAYRAGGAARQGHPARPGPGTVPHAHAFPWGKISRGSIAMVKRFYAFIFLALIVWLAFEMATPRADFLP